MLFYIWRWFIHWLLQNYWKKNIDTFYLFSLSAFDTDLIYWASFNVNVTILNAANPHWECRTRRHESQVAIHKALFGGPWRCTDMCRFIMIFFDLTSGSGRVSSVLELEVLKSLTLGSARSTIATSFREALSGNLPPVSFIFWGGKNTSKKEQMAPSRSLAKGRVL